MDALRIHQAIAGFFQEGEKPVSQPDHGSPIEKNLVTKGSSIADEITLTATEEKCDLIVMGCKQQGMLAGAFGNHMVRKVLKRSHEPVFVVPFSQ